MASIFFPMWPIDLIRRRHKAGPIDANRSTVTQRSILIVMIERGMQVVVHCCERARSAGVKPGMNLAHARALLSVEPQMEPFDPRRDGESLQRLAVWAQRYSPIVAPDPPDGLLIDITGCQRLFRSEAHLARLMTHDLQRLGIHARVAIASTFACAAAVARSDFGFWILDFGFGVQSKIQNPKSKIPCCVVPHRSERTALAPLPLASLRLEPHTIEALHEVEIIRLGQLFNLPRAQLADRYGETLLLQLDQALGLGGALEAIEPVRLQNPPREQHEFDGPVLQIEGIELMTRSLLERLVDQLQRLERGVLRLDVEFNRIDAPPMRLSVRLSHPSRNVKHLWSLLRPKIEKVNLGFGVEQITLTASRSAVLSHQQEEISIAADSQIKTHDSKSRIVRGELIDTLSSRLGAERVLRMERRQSHVPERSFRMVCAIERSLSSDDAIDRVAVADRPALLLSRPESIAIEIQHDQPLRMRWGGHEHAIVQCIGPEAIASEWWHESPSGLREYYKVQDDCGRWLWIYRQHVGDRWFIQGMWL